MKKRLASFLSRVLPRKVWEALKRFYYFLLLAFVKEEREVDFVIVKQLVPRGGCVLDIGANVGIYAKLLSKLVGPDGEVVSFEPVPGTFQILKSNIAKLRLKNVRLSNLAVSDFCGRVNISVPHSAQGVDNIYEARITRDKIADSETFEVDAKTLDELRGEINRKVDFVKCDVEGHELAVIRGASDFIRSQRPSWLIEISKDPDAVDSPANILFSLMGEHGYAAFWFDGAILRKRAKGDKSVNYFFLQPEMIDRLKTDRIIL